MHIFYQNKEITNSSLPETFEELKIHEKLLKNLNKMLFSAMTPIQKYVMPYILEGNDVMGCSQTGK